MSGSSSDQASQSNQPSQKQQKGGQKEDSPEGPKEQGEQEGQQPDGQPQGQPRGNQGDPPPTPKQPARAAPDDETQDPLMASPDREQWGNLPVHMQELFRAEGGERMPTRYRDWIESYYRRLNDR